MKKALIVSNSSGLISLFLNNDITILRDKGYIVDVACNTSFPDSNTRDFFSKYCNNIYHVDFPIRNLDISMILKSFYQLTLIIKHGQYNVLHCHSTIAAVIARQCAKKYRGKGLKVIYTSHGFPFYEGNFRGKARLFWIIEKYYSKYTDAIITICNEDYIKAKKMKCKTVCLMHGVGIDVDRFVSIKINRDEYRKKLELKDSDKVILSVGELNRNKNHQIIIKALSLLNDSNYLYVICGREVTEIGKRDELEKLAQKLNVRIKFLGFRQDIPEICHSVEIGAIPSYKEGLGLSGIEMLASGIPIVGSNRQGIKDYVKINETGYLANPESEESFAIAIKQAFRLKEKKCTKQNCIDMAKNFSVEQSYDMLLKVYNAIGV